MEQKDFVYPRDRATVPPPPTGSPPKKLPLRKKVSRAERAARSKSAQKAFAKFFYDHKSKDPKCPKTSPPPPPTSASEEKIQKKSNIVKRRHRRNITGIPFIPPDMRYSEKGKAKVVVTQADADNFVLDCSCSIARITRKGLIEIFIHFLKQDDITIHMGQPHKENRINLEIAGNRILIWCDGILEIEIPLMFKHIITGNHLVKDVHYTEREIVQLSRLNWPSGHWSTHTASTDYQITVSGRAS